MRFPLSTFTPCMPRTIQVYHSDLPPGAESSLAYTFSPDHRLEPRDFVVALTVIYHDNKGSYFSNTFFNSTIEIVEEKKMVDWELLSLVVMLGGLAAGGCECCAVQVAIMHGMQLPTRTYTKN